MPVRLFVGNLPYEASEGDIREYFSGVAPPLQVFLPVDRDTGRPRGFAFVEFAERTQAEEAIERFNNRPFKGRTISVSEARARDSRPPGPGGGGGGGSYSRPPGPGGGGGFGGPPSGDRPPRPPGPRFGGPSASAPPDFEQEGRRRRQKPPPGRGGQKAERPKRSGPIPVRGGSRLYSVDDTDEDAIEVEAEEFDDVASPEKENGDDVVSAEKDTGEDEER
jgi:cold-inducible RNA-binding protein